MLRPPRASSSLVVIGPSWAGMRRGVRCVALFTPEALAGFKAGIPVITVSEAKRPLGPAVQSDLAKELTHGRTPYSWARGSRTRRLVFLVVGVVHERAARVVLASSSSAVKAVARGIVVGL